MSNIVLRFAAQGLERAERVAQAIIGTVQRARTAAREVTNEIRTSTRQAAQELRSLRAQAAAGNPLGASAVTRFAGQANALAGRIGGVANALQSGSPTQAMLGAAQASGIPIAQIAAQIVGPILAQVDAKIDQKTSLMNSALQIELEASRRSTWAWRMENDPDFQRQQSRAAFDATVLLDAFAAVVSETTGNATITGELRRMFERG